MNTINEPYNLQLTGKEPADVIRDTLKYLIETECVHYAEKPLSPSVRGWLKSPYLYIKELLRAKESLIRETQFKNISPESTTKEVINAFMSLLPAFGRADYAIGEWLSPMAYINQQLRLIKAVETESRSFWTGFYEAEL